MVGFLGGPFGPSLPVRAADGRGGSTGQDSAQLRHMHKLMSFREDKTRTVGSTKEGTLRAKKGTLRLTHEGTLQGPY
jgi:hypothetical protein